MAHKSDVALIKPCVIAVAVEAAVADSAFDAVAGNVVAAVVAINTGDTISMRSYQANCWPISCLRHLFRSLVLCCSGLALDTLLFFLLSLSGTANVSLPEPRDGGFRQFLISDLTHLQHKSKPHMCVNSHRVTMCK